MAEAAIYIVVEVEEYATGKIRIAQHGNEQINPTHFSPYTGTA